MLFPAQGFGAAHLENPSGGLNDGALISVLTARRHQPARRRPFGGAQSRRLDASYTEAMTNESQLTFRY